MTGATFFKTVGCKLSGPAALDGFRPVNNLRTPFLLTWVLGILVNLRFRNGMDSVSSEEKFRQNCWFKVVLFSDSDSARWSCWSRGID